MQKSYMRALLISLVLVAFSSSAFAVDLLVGAGQTYTSVSAALTAAAAGDTIIIMDSGTYTEAATLTINKSVAIVAAAGANPTLTCSGTTGIPVVNVVAGAAGGRLGSVGGGKINVDRAFAIGGLANAAGINVAGIATGETYTIENVYVTRFTTGGIQSSGVRGTLNLNVVEIDGNFSEADRNLIPVPPAPRAGIRIFGTTLAAGPVSGNFGGTFNLNRVSVHNIDSHCLILNTSSGAYLNDVKLNVDTCEFSTYQHGGLIFGNNTGVVANVDNCYFMVGGGVVNASGVMVHSGWSALRFAWTTATAGTAGGNITVTNSVLAHWPNFSTVGVVNYPGGSANSNNVNTTIDHCDIIVPLGATSITTDSIRSRTGIVFGRSTNRNITLTNTNIYGPDYNDAITTPARISGLLLASGSTGTNNIDYNNFWVSDYPTSGVTVGNHEVTPARDPLYTDRANRDFRYTDPIILTASSTGGPLGVNAIMANIVPVELSSFGLN